MRDITERIDYYLIYIGFPVCMRDTTERIDELCEWMYGHTHWVCMDTLSDQEKVGLDKVADIGNVDGQQVAFYHGENYVDPQTPVREALKEVSISIACALEDNMENLQMSDLEHIQDKITELENLIDPVPFTNGQRQGVTHD
jgi:hypothetical protein|tara:strand:+ start:351 stop:776 length:426 start_codon:yes stop_codon:yes gene_type:complete